MYLIKAVWCHKASLIIQFGGTHISDLYLNNFINFPLILIKFASEYTVHQNLSFQIHSLKILPFPLNLSSMWVKRILQMEKKITTYMIRDHKGYFKNKLTMTLEQKHCLIERFGSLNINVDLSTSTK